MIRVNKDGQNEIALVNIFKAVQGEGPEAGLGSTVFIRVHKCNLRCPWCDTKESWTEENLTNLYEDRISWKEPYLWMTALDIFKKVEELESNFINKSICLTGGEPLMEENKEFMINELLPLFNNSNYSIDIETNGAIDYSDYKKHFDNCEILDPEGHRKGVYFSMDWKLPASKMNHKMIEKNLYLLNHYDILKVVITDDEADWKELERLLTLNINCPIYISPCFSKVDTTRLPQFILEHPNNNLKVQVQLHKIFYDPLTKDV